jgi:hypothetical protein
LASIRKTFTSKDFFGGSGGSGGGERAVDFSDVVDEDEQQAYEDYISEVLTGFALFLFFSGR